jgi:hypothetical protein
MTMEPGQGGALDRVLRVGPWVVAGVLISVPLLAMQVTDEVDWTLSDFAIIGALLFGGCALYELAARSTRSITHRLAVGSPSARASCSSGSTSPSASSAARITPPT